MRVGVLVSGEGTNLQALLDDREIDVVCVASNKPDARGLERARGAGVATAVFQAKDYSDRPDDDRAGRNARDRALADWLESRQAELVVLAGFMELLSSGFIARFPQRIVNVHPALLPAFPGVRAVEQALEYGVKVMGVTVHFVDEGVDSGPIILQEAFELPYPRDIERTEERAHEVEHRLLPRAVRLIAAGAVRADPDNPRHVIVDDRDG